MFGWLSADAARASFRKRRARSSLPANEAGIVFSNLRAGDGIERFRTIPCAGNDFREIVSCAGRNDGHWNAGTGSQQPVRDVVNGTIAAGRCHDRGAFLNGVASKLHGMTGRPRFVQLTRHTSATELLHDLFAQAARATTARFWIQDHVHRLRRHYGC